MMSVRPPGVQPESVIVLVSNKVVRKKASFQLQVDLWGPLGPGFYGFVFVTSSEKTVSNTCGFLQHGHANLLAVSEIRRQIV